MSKIDTSKWEPFVVGSLFYKLDLKITKDNFNKAMDVSTEKTEEFSLPLVNAKHFDNGIMYYGRNCDFESAEMTLDVVKNGAIATGDVYAQPQKTGVLWDAYLIKPFKDISSERVLLYLATVLEKTIKDKFSYDDKCIWEKVKKLTVMLPVDENYQPDFSYMETYMKNRESAVSSSLTALRSAKRFSKSDYVETKNWNNFKISTLFSVKRPAARSQTKYVSGNVPFVASGNYNNGVLKYLTPQNGEVCDKGNCITVSPIDGSAFYQKEDFLGRGGAGSSIIMLYNDKLNIYNGMFIASIIRTVCQKYYYSDMANKDLISDELIKLPADKNGNPDYQYMEDYIKKIAQKSKQTLDNLKSVIV